MKITIDELSKVIDDAIEELSATGKKGVGGYKQDDDYPTLPRGYGSSLAHDLSKPPEEGNRYKGQGAANFGPYTNENAIRHIVKSMLNESIKLKQPEKPRMMRKLSDKSLNSIFEMRTRKKR